MAPALARKRRSSRSALHCEPPLRWFWCSRGRDSLPLVRPSRLSPRFLALLLSLAAACHLVGYDELHEASGTTDAGFVGSIVPEPSDASSVLHEGGLDGGSLPAIDASAVADAAGDAGWDALSAADSAVDTGPSSPQDGWWDGLPPDQVCSDGEACYPQCMAPGDRCVFDCADASDCEVTCSPASVCHVDCQSADYCELACKTD